MESELYLDYGTPYHRLDARTKLIVFLGVFVGALMFKNPIWQLPTAALVLLQVAVSRSWRNLYRIRFVLLVMSVSSIILWNFFSSGTTPLFWIFEVESMFYAINRTMTILMIVSMGVVLISTTRNEELIMGMIRMGLPYRVGFAVSTSLRLVPTVASSLMTISQAQRSRGLDLETGNIVDRLKKFLPLLVPVFISSIRNTNIFGMALESRGFGARPDRTYYLQMRMRATDWVLLALLLLYVAASIWLNIAGYGRIVGLTNF
ncbi:MAG: energy-coupling factor transporter transmembrane protein EcfT [Anaerolineae bacterium]|jgi:energy-coupling factor transport system permease protein|nr:energy-coupling factor transporter transmembrane protein EcfT [Anaerolineae bacterium]